MVHGQIRSIEFFATYRIMEQNSNSSISNSSSIDVSHPEWYSAPPQHAKALYSMIYDFYSIFIAERQLEFHVNSNNLFLEFKLSRINLAVFLLDTIEVLLDSLRKSLQLSLIVVIVIASAVGLNLQQNSYYNSHQL